MSLVDDFGDSDRSPRAGWLQRLAHLFPWVVLALLARSALTWTGVIPASGWWRFPTIAIAVGLLLVGFMHAALARLCLQCMQEVPHDAPVRAGTRRKRSWLRLAHWHRVWRVLAVIVVWDLSEYAVARFALGLPEVPPWMHAPLDLFICALFWSFWQHHRYRPWCPWCRDWDEGGDHECAPDPVVPGTKVA